MAKAVSSASGLTREISINPLEYPVIRWKWKIENILKKGDVGSKAYLWSVSAAFGYKLHMGKQNSGRFNTP